MARSNTSPLILVLLPAALSLCLPKFSFAQTPTPQKLTVVPSGQQKAPSEVLAGQAAQVKVPPVSLQLTADDKKPLINQLVHFTATWSQPVKRASYHFDWGDTHFTDGISPLEGHPYTSAGVYTVTVTAKTVINGQTVQRTSKPLTISVRPLPPPSPVLKLKADNTNPFVNQVVHFRVTWNQHVSRASYRFIWGDDHNESKDTPAADHAYSAAKVYTAYAAAQVSVNGQLRTLRSRPVTMNVIPLPPREHLPVPSLSASPSHPKAGETVTFTATIDSSAVPAEYHFYFDDGADAATSFSTYTHPYTLPGTYHPYVSALFDQANSAQVSDKIELNVDNPTLTVDVHTRKPVAGDTVSVQASLDPPQEGSSYVFDWGDNSGFEKAAGNGAASHRYRFPGTYTVGVSAWLNGAGFPIKENRQVAVGWPVSILLILGVVLTGAICSVVWRLTRPHLPKPAKTPPPPPDFRVKPFPGKTDGEISVKEQAGSHLSLTLNPGVDPEEHKITFL